MITAELDKSPIEIVSDISSEVEILNKDIVTGSDNQQEAIVEDLDNLEISVAKKEYAIVGDGVYIPQLYDDAPQWMKDLVGLVVDVSMTTNSTQLINDMNAMLQKFAVSYVPLNQYTQSILDLGNEDMRLNAFIETLNSNFNNGISNANAQIINLQMTKASKDEVLAQVIQTLAAQLADPNSNLGATVVRLDRAIATEQQARALSMSVLTSTINGVNDDVIANAEVVQNALAYVGIDEAGASTGTGLSAYLQSSNGAIGGADSKVANDIRVTAEGVESKWAYNSVVNINGVYRKSGFGLTANNLSGGGTKANPYNSEFWIDATKLRFTNSANTGRTAPFTIDASGATPQITFNGVVKFSNVTGTTALYDSINTAQSTANIANNNAIARTLPSEVAAAVNNNVTTINGSKITTGSITAAQIQANSISADRLTSTNGRSTVWTGGGLVSTNFNGNAHGTIGTPTRGFRLSSNAAGTEADPNVYGAYIRGGTVEGAVIKGGLLTGTSLLVNNMVVQSEYSSIHYGKIMHYASRKNAAIMYYKRSYREPYFITQAAYDALPNHTKDEYVESPVTILSGGAFGPGSSDSVTVGLEANRVTSASSNIQCVFNVGIAGGDGALTSIRLYLNDKVVFLARESSRDGSGYVANYMVELKGSDLDPYKENKVFFEKYTSSSDGYNYLYRYYAPSALIYNM